jgi:hypothetical protein
MAGILIPKPKPPVGSFDGKFYLLLGRGRLKVMVQMILKGINFPLISGSKSCIVYRSELKYPNFKGTEGVKIRCCLSIVPYSSRQGGK